MYIAFCVGQVAAPQLFISTEAPVYQTAFRAAFVCFAVNIVLSFVLRYYLIWENRRRDQLAAAAEVDGVDNNEFLDRTDKQQKSVFRYRY